MNLRFSLADFLEILHLKPKNEAAVTLYQDPYFFIKLMCSASPRHEHILHFCFLVGKASFNFPFNAASHIHRAQKAHLVIDSLERSCSDCWAKRRRHTAKTCSPRSKSHYHSDGNSYHSPIALDLNEVNLIFLSV